MLIYIALSALIVVAFKIFVGKCSCSKDVLHKTKKSLLTKTTMRAWQVEKPGEPLLLKIVPVPAITKPDQIIIKVKAFSINNIDTAVVKGYGQQLLSKMKMYYNWDWNAQHFPLIAGRDCSGIVEAVGADVHHLSPGDEVMAVIPAHLPGSHAEYVLTNTTACVRKPDNLTFVEATALPYVFSTAWAALVTKGGLAPYQHEKMKDKRVLVHGGSGGVGTVTIQMLKSFGVEMVAASCSLENVPLVQKYGAIALNYQSDSFEDQMKYLGPYDVIFDCVDNDITYWSDTLLRNDGKSVHVTIRSTLMKDIIEKGLFFGFIQFFKKLRARNQRTKEYGGRFVPAFFAAKRDCMEYLLIQAEDNKVQPVIEEVVSFLKVPAAYTKVSGLHGKGKTVVEVK